jgi:hypothetical protein
MVPNKQQARLRAKESEDENAVQSKKAERARRFGVPVSSSSRSSEHKMARVSEQMEDVKRVLMNNMDSLVLSGVTTKEIMITDRSKEKLESLVDRSEDLRTASLSFRRRSTTLRKQRTVANIKVSLAVILAGVALLALLCGVYYYVGLWNFLCVAIVVAAIYYAEKLPRKSVDLYETGYQERCTVCHTLYGHTITCKMSSISGHQEQQPITTVQSTSKTETDTPTSKVKLRDYSGDYGRCFQNVDRSLTRRRKFFGGSTRSKDRIAVSVVSRIDFPLTCYYYKTNHLWATIDLS